jgi:hypothetical protein
MELALATTNSVPTIAEVVFLLIALGLVILGVATNATKYVGIGVIVLIVGLLIIKLLPM